MFLLIFVLGHAKIQSVKKQNNGKLQARSRLVGDNPVVIPTRSLFVGKTLSYGTRLQGVRLPGFLNIPSIAFASSAIAAKHEKVPIQPLRFRAFEPFAFQDFKP